MTQTAMQYQEEATTYSFFIPSEEFDDENRMKLAASQHFAQVQKIQGMAVPHRNIAEYCRKIRANNEVDLFNELILSRICCISEIDDVERTETAPREEHEHLNERNASNVAVSEQVAAKLRAKEVSAFVPVSAADLIWLEALSMDEDPDE